MALSSRALTTLLRVKTEIGVAQSQDSDDALSFFIETASAAIEQVIGRKLYYEADIVENMAGFDRPLLLVERTPLVALTSVELIDQAGNVLTTYDSTTYEIDDANQGSIYRSDCWPATGLMTGTSQFVAPNTERKSIQVTYSGGWVTQPQEDEETVDENNDPVSRTLPYDLEYACIMTVSSLFRRKGRDRNIQSEGVMQGPITSYRDGSGSILPLEAMKIVGQYRRVV